MDSLPLIVGVSGSVSRPSRATALVSLIVGSVMAKVDAEASIIELAEAAPHLFRALTREHLSERARSILQLVESDDHHVATASVRDRAERAAVEAAIQLRRASSPLLRKVGALSPA